MERMLIGLLVLGLMLAIMVVIAWLAIRESRREYDEGMRRMGEEHAGHHRADPPIRTSVAAQTPDPSPS
jgi:hypothetical protein